MEICENCYDEVNTVFNMKGMQVCKTCIADIRGGTNKTEAYEEESVALLDNFDDMPGVMSDNDVIDMIRSDYF
jgi:hypothetical protein